MLQCLHCSHRAAASPTSIQRVPLRRAQCCPVLPQGLKEAGDEEEGAEAET